MTQFRIQGGTPLKGSVSLSGAKNASFKLMIAAALGEGETTLTNMSQIGDVAVTYKTLEEIGILVAQPSPHTVVVTGSPLTTHIIPRFAGEKTRAATLFAGLLLAKQGRGIIPLPGGCALGDRPIDRHLHGLSALGATVNQTSKGIELAAPRGLHGASFRFPKKSHTGTEALILAAVLAKGRTVIENAGLEPEIDDLISLLNQMGAKITRVKTNDSIIIEGVKKLYGATHQVMPDRNEAVSFACMAIASQGDVVVEGARANELEAFLTALDRVGAGYEASGEGIRFFYQSPLHAVDITTQPEPGFMTDWQPLWTTLMTMVQGVSHITEAVHNNRLAFTKELNRMGANIKLYDPSPADPSAFYQFDYPERVANYHAAEVTGPTPLVGTTLKVPDLRGGATLVMAAIMARGESVISGIEHIDRGYENFEGRLTSLSANIARE